VIKTRLQTAAVPFASPLDCLVWTVRREGTLALWKGFTPQLIASVPYSTVMFGVYEILKPLSTHPRSEFAHIGSCFVAGAASGVAVTVVHNPLELWRVRAQTHLTPTGGGSAFRSVLRRPWQLGRGASMTLLENVLGNGVFFSSNEAMRRVLAKGTASLGLGQEALVGGMTGILFQLVAYPADLVKARLMTQEGIQARQVARQVLQHEGGLRGFYRGYSLPPFLASSVFFLVSSVPSFMAWFFSFLPSFLPSVLLGARASVTLFRACIINAAGWPALKWAQRRLGV
jgi:solute carrier family 25 carnitine/acylcarnitine transporter 20/29